MKSRKAKRIMSILLAFLMVFSVIQSNAVAVNAYENEEETAAEVLETAEEIPAAAVEEVDAAPAEEEAVVLEETAPEVESIEETAVQPETPELTEELAEEETFETVELDLQTFEFAESSLSEADLGVMLHTESNAVSSYDLADYLKSVEVIDETPSVQANAKVVVKLGWLISGGVHGGSDVFTYKLPVNFEILNDVVGPITKGANGPTIGQFFINKDGDVRISYNADYNTDSQTTVNYMEITGTAKHSGSREPEEIKFSWEDGEKVIVVRTQDTFQVAKSVEKVWPNGQLSSQSKLNYTVEISSDLGTYGDFVVEDKITTGGGSQAIKSVKMIADSFVVRKGNQVITGWDVKLSNNNTEYTLTGLPQLAAGESYTLTYQAEVQRGTASNEYVSVFGNVNNTVRVKSDGAQKSATTQTSYSQIMSKQAGVIQEDGSREWTIRLYANGTDMTNFTLKDTPLEGATISKPVKVEYLGYVNGLLVSLGSQEVTADNPSEFTYRIPFAQANGVKINEWKFTIYTNKQLEAGVTSASTSNQATLIAESGETWTKTAKSVIGDGRSVHGTPTKAFLGSNEVAGTSLYSFRWKLSIGVGSEAADSVVFTDVLHNGQMGRQDQWGNFDYYGTLPGAHYGIASELQADLTNESTGLHIKPMSGEVKDYSYSQAIAAGYQIAIQYYPNMAATEGEVEIAADDTTTPVRRFVVTVTPPNGEKASSIQTIYANQYRTVMDGTDVLTGYTGAAYNELLYGETTSRVLGRVKKGVGEISKLIESPDNYPGHYRTYFTTNPGTFDYDKSNGTLKYLLLVTVPTGQDEIAVTDWIPAGLTLAADAGGDIAYDNNLKVGVYTTKDGVLRAPGSPLTAQWSDSLRRQNISVTQEKEGEHTRLSVTVTNLNKALSPNHRIIGIAYTVKMDNYFGNLENTEKIQDGEDTYYVHTFHNAAQFGDVQTSLDATVKQKESILTKTGEQVKENGAYTSRVHYTVQINPSALDLIADSDELTLTDLMSADTLDFRLDPTSIQLRYMDGKAVSPLSIHVNQPEEGDVTTQSFEIKVQDATAYILEYDFIVNKRDSSTAATEGSLVNKIELAGYASTEEKTNVQGIIVRASSNHSGLQLVKVEAGNNANFLKADFALDVYKDGSYQPVQTVEMEGQRGYSFDYYAENNTLEGYRVYRLVEQNAPNGYVKDETPFYFVIMGPIEQVRLNAIEATNLDAITVEQAIANTVIPEGLDVNDIHFLPANSGSYFEITNAKKAAVTLTGTKNLTGREMVDGEFTFTVTENGAKVASGTNDANGNIVFDEMTYEEAGNHMYVVTENTASGNGVSYDTTSYEVQVNVVQRDDKSLHAEVIYPENGMVFNNTYTATGELTLDATKELTGRTMTEGEFTFTVTENGTQVASGTNDANGNVVFSTISYTLQDVGTHSYVVSEVAGQDPAITYSSQSYTVDVTVSDGGNGTLLVEQADPLQKRTFTNTYASQGSVVLTAWKELAGRDLADGEFTFAVTENGAEVATAANDADGRIVFTPIAYTTTDAGTHTYEVKEKAGNLDGVIYDTTTFQVTVEVSDDGAGTLTAEPTYPEGGVVFKNRYEADTTITLDAYKTLSGRTLQVGEFTFVIIENDVEIATAANDADGKVTFGPLHYTQDDAGTHTYIMREMEGTLPGVTYDTTAYQITVEVVDDGAGNLTATSTYPEGGANFTNTYEASGELTLQATKILNGRNLSANEFEFVVEENGVEAARATNDADGSIVFPTISYTQDDVGRHVYTIAEVQGSAEGVTYSTVAYTLEVVVTDNADGTLDVAYTYPGNGITFTNTYDAAGGIVLEAEKVLTGRTLQAGEFSFTITENGTTIANAANDSNGKISFPLISYTLEDIGTHTYVLSEDAGTLGGVTYDRTTFTVTVEVEDDGKGNLIATSTYPEGGVKFGNTYDAEGSIELVAEKVLTGRTLNDGEFTFVITENGTEIATATNDANGRIAFPLIDYTLEDVGTHTYVMREVEGTLGGVTYDASAFTITVEVEDDGAGNLTATFAYPEGGAKFGNTYEAQGSVQLEAEKVLTGRTLQAGEFVFVIKENGKTVATAKNDADGRIVFPLVNYTLEDVGTHEYVMTEIKGNLGGVTYDTAAFTITVEVEDDGAGNLTATSTYPEGGAKFGNTYEAEGSVQLEAEKVLTGRTLNDGEFTFVITENDVEIATATNDANGRITFPLIDYTLEDVDTHTYIMREVEGTLGGVTYDTAAFTITVEVEDDGKGNLTATSTYPEGGVKFGNTYDTESVKLGLSANKELTGRNLKDGEFTFTITEEEEIVAQGTNDENGLVQFSEIEYTLQDVGTHTLVVREVTGEKGGVTYSEETYTVVVTVRDNGDGALNLAMVLDEDAMVFHNRYNAKEVTVGLTAKKNYTGAVLKDGQFSFTLHNSNGAVIETVQNDENGEITFSDLTFTEVGTYTFSISEVQGTENRVTYDTKQYTVTITVTDDEEGQLLAQVETAGEEIVFTNKYTPEQPHSPKTGDERNAWLWMTMMLLSSLGVLVWFKKRKEDIV